MAVDLGAAVVAVPASPQIESGFRCVFVKRTEQWLLHLGTGEKITISANVQGGLLSIEDGILMPQYKTVETGVHSEPVVASALPVHVRKQAFLLFEKQKMVRADKTFYFYDLKKKMSAEGTHDFKTGSFKFGDEEPFLAFHFQQPIHGCRVMVRVQDLRAPLRSEPQ